MARLTGVQRMVLQAIHELPKNATGFVTDAQIAQGTRITLADVRDSIEILEGDGIVDVVRREEDLSAAINASGRQTLRQFRPFDATPSESVDPDDSTSGTPETPTPGC